MPRSERRGERSNMAAELTCAAIEDRLIAEEYDRAGADSETADVLRMHAEVCEKEANKLLVVDEQPEIGAGGEVVPKKTDRERAEAAYFNPLDTLEKDPSMVNIESSAKRVFLRVHRLIALQDFDSLLHHL